MPKKITILIKDKPKKDGLGVDVSVKMDEMSSVTDTEKKASQVVFNGISAVLQELSKIK